jgi:hypothetical protein
MSSDTRKARRTVAACLLILAPFLVPLQALAQPAPASAASAGRAPAGAPAASAPATPAAASPAGVDALRALIEADRKRRAPASTPELTPAVRAALQASPGPLPQGGIVLEAALAPRDGAAGSKQPRLVAILGRPGREVAVVRWQDVDHSLARAGQPLGASGWTLRAILPAEGRVEMTRTTQEANRRTGTATVVLDFAGATPAAALSVAATTPGPAPRATLQP